MRERLIVALDTPSMEQALGLVEKLQGRVGLFKVGMELFYAHGPAAVRKIARAGTGVFLDLKLHDIPNTVAGSIAQLAALGAEMINVHAGGGLAMMVAARETLHRRAGELGISSPKLIAVTVLTSITAAQLQGELGIKRNIQDQVVELAKLAREAGLDGVVASPQEIGAVKRACGPDFLTVTPGIRPAWAQQNDQARVMTPREAVQLGGDYIVIGRPITGAADAVEAADKILTEMGAD